MRMCVPDMDGASLILSDQEFTYNNHSNESTDMDVDSDESSNSRRSEESADEGNSSGSETPKHVKDEIKIPGERVIGIDKNGFKICYIETWDGDQVECRFCLQKAIGKSGLLQHHCLIHFQEQLTSELQGAFNESSGKCFECDFTTVQFAPYLIHLGVVHERVIPYVTEKVQEIILKEEQGTIALPDSKSDLKADNVSVIYEDKNMQSFATNAENVEINSSKKEGNDIPCVTENVQENNLKEEKTNTGLPTSNPPYNSCDLPDNINMIPDISKITQSSVTSAKYNLPDNVSVIPDVSKNVQIFATNAESEEFDYLKKQENDIPIKEQVRDNNDKCVSKKVSENCKDEIINHVSNTDSLQTSKKEHDCDTKRENENNDSSVSEAFEGTFQEKENDVNMPPSDESNSDRADKRKSSESFEVDDDINNISPSAKKSKLDENCQNTNVASEEIFHKEEDESKENKDFHCEYCDNRYKLQDGFKEHLISHFDSELSKTHDGKQCLHCEKEFPLHKLNHHMGSIHDKIFDFVSEYTLKQLNEKESSSSVKVSGINNDMIKLKENEKSSDHQEAIATCEDKENKPKNEIDLDAVEEPYEKIEENIDHQEMKGSNEENPSDDKEYKPNKLVTDNEKDVIRDNLNTIMDQKLITEIETSNNDLSDMDISQVEKSHEDKENEPSKVILKNVQNMIKGNSENIKGQCTEKETETSEGKCNEMKVSFEEKSQENNESKYNILITDNQENKIKGNECVEVKNICQSMKKDKGKKSTMKKDYHCEYCDKRFKMLGGFKDHLTGHFKKELKEMSNSVNCPYCKRQFLAKYHLAHHIGIQHDKIFELVSTYTLNQFNPSDVGPSEKNSITDDDKDMSTNDSSDNDCDEVEIIYEEQISKSDNAQKRFEKIKKKSKRGNNFHCEYCDKMFHKDNHSRFREHIISHFGKELRQMIRGKSCHYCSKKLSSESSLGRHLGMAHNKILDLVSPYMLSQLGWREVSIPGEGSSQAEKKDIDDGKESDDSEDEVIILETVNKTSKSQLKNITKKKKELSSENSMDENEGGNMNNKLLQKGNVDKLNHEKIESENNSNEPQIVTGIAKELNDIEEIVCEVDIETDMNTDVIMKDVEKINAVSNNYTENDMPKDTKYKIDIQNEDLEMEICFEANVYEPAIMECETEKAIIQEDISSKSQEEDVVKILKQIKEIEDRQNDDKNSIGSPSEWSLDYESSKKHDEAILKNTSKSKFLSKKENSGAIMSRCANSMNGLLNKNFMKSENMNLDNSRKIRYECDKCDESFEKPFLLKNHSVVHSGSSYPKSSLKSRRLFSTLHEREIEI